MALIPSFFLDCVVAIGVRAKDNSKLWIGTGFLLGRPHKQGGKNQYHVFLVTNKHVLRDKDVAIVRFNPQNDEPARDYEIPLKNANGETTWTPHSNDDVDVAVLMINPKILEKHKVRYSYFAADQHTMSLKQMAMMGMSEGDFIYVLGFPMGFVAPDRQYVVARSGSVARIRDTMEGRALDFLVDAFIFPGNSGGPVITKPELVSINGTQAIDKAALIGMITGYVPFSDVAISQRTQRPRIVFEENSGLGSAVTTDFIMEAIETCLATKSSVTVDTAQKK